MPKTLFLWLIFSFIAFLLFSNLKINPKSTAFIRGIFTLLSLPLLILSSYIFYLSTTGESEIIHLNRLTYIPLDLSIHINQFNSAIIFTTFISLSIFILTANYNHLSNLFRTIIISLFFIVFSQIPLNLMITIYTLNVGNIFLLFSIINSNIRNLSNIHEKNYYWLIICDFFPAFAFFILPNETIQYSLNKNFINQSTLDNNFGLILLITYSIKLLIMPSIKNDFSNNSISNKINHSQLIIYNCLSSMLILLEARSFLFSLYSSSLIIFPIILLCYTIINFFLDKKNNIESNITIFVSIFSFFAINTYFNIAIKAFICIIILSITFQIETISKRLVTTKNNTTGPKNEFTYHIAHALNNIAFKSLTITANIVSNFIGQIYGNIMLIKIPQLIIGIIQIPLRIFHNGSIKRSVLFIIIMVISYYYIWEIQ